jgi:hypothetical protein
VALARRVDDEEAVLMLHIRHPEQWPLWEIDDFIRHARIEPVERFGDFRRVLRAAWLPGPLRRLLMWAGLQISGDWRARYFGTFGITSVGALGSALTHVLCPLTTSLTYGVFEEDGSVLVRLFFDHRVLDGALVAMALQELQQVFHGPILEELRGASRCAA